MKKEILSDYSWVIRGSQRILILNALKTAQTPNQIQKETKLKFSNVSDGLKKMVEKNIVVCLNPDERMGRIYKLTEKGEEILKLF